MLVTVVSSLVAIAAVSVCTILSAIVTQRGARKAKQSELLFHEMTNAYYDFLRAAEKLISGTGFSALSEFSEASTRAMLFASPETQELIAKYGEAIHEMKVANQRKSSNTLELARDVGFIRKDLVKAMQKDLRQQIMEYQCYQ